MTDRIEKEAWAYIDKIEEMGGMVKAIERGYVQKEIQDTAFKYQLDIEKGVRIVVGVNKYTIEEEPPKDLLKVDPAIRDIQIKKLEEAKKNRNNERAAGKLATLREGAGDREVNLMPLILEAVREYATLGEICNVLRAEFGEYRESVVL